MISIPHSLQTRRKARALRWRLQRPCLRVLSKAAGLIGLGRYIILRQQVLQHCIPQNLAVTSKASSRHMKVSVKGERHRAESVQYELQLRPGHCSCARIPAPKNSHGSPALCKANSCLCDEAFACEESLHLRPREKTRGWRDVSCDLE